MGLNFRDAPRVIHDDELLPGRRPGMQTATQMLMNLQSRLPDHPHTWLVTGAAGFIGSNLVEALLSLGQRVVGLDNFSTGHRHNIESVLSAVDENRRLFRFIEGDIRNPDTCQSACTGVDIVLHQAALGSVPRSVNDPFTTHQVNVDGTLNMLIAARDASVNRFVFASSSSVYGDNKDLPKHEDRIGAPLSPYAVSKRACEMYAHIFHQTYGLETLGLRYFNVFGKRQDPEGAYAAVVPKWISGIYRGEVCYINGDGQTSRDFCHVSNVVAANILAGTAPSDAVGHVYNIAVGEQSSLNKLFQVIAGAIGSYRTDIGSVEPVYRDFRAGDIHHSLASIEKAKSLLGYAPVTRMEDGLSETVSWYVSELDQQRTAV